jgi:hypothetical protein
MDELFFISNQRNHYGYIHVSVPNFMNISYFSVDSKQHM